MYEFYMEAFWFLRVANSAFAMEVEAAARITGTNAEEAAAHGADAGLGGAQSNAARQPTNNALL